MKLTATIVLVFTVLASLLVSPLGVAAEFGIDPAKVMVDDLSAGTQAEFNLILYNRGGDDLRYRVVARTPDYTTEGYEALPYLDWVTIEPSELLVKAGEQATLLVTLAMPEGADYNDKKAEVWISVKEAEADTMIQIELASRILISTTAAAVTPPDTEKPEPGEPPTTPTTPPTTPPAPASTSPWTIFGIAAVVLLAGYGGYAWFKRKRGSDAA